MGNEKKMTEAEKHAFKFYDSETGELLGRTMSSWGKIIIFYLAYFSFLTGLFIASLQIMQKPLNNLEKPLLNTRLNIPGLNMFPKFDLNQKEQKDRLKDNDDVEFLWEKGTKDGKRGWGYYQQKTKEVLDLYSAEPDEAENVETFSTSELGSCSTGNYGWDTDEPCIFIRLNRVIDWEPVGLFKTDEETAFKAASLKNAMVADAVYIRCAAGPVGLDKEIEPENVPEFEYFGGVGSDGLLEKKYFPYKGNKKQPGYQSPIVAVKISNISEKRKEGYQITCEAFARNIVGKDKDNGYNGVIKFIMKMIPN